MIYRNLFNHENYDALRDLQVSFGWSNQQLDYLIACMKFESNLNPAARNKISGAVGLIQFLPSTLKAFNLTPADVLTMNFSTQIKLVKIMICIWQSSCLFISESLIMQSYLLRVKELITRIKP